MCILQNDSTILMYEMVFYANIIIRGSLGACFTAGRAQQSTMKMFMEFCARSHPNALCNNDGIK